MHGSNTCFIWKIDLRMFTINIESYGDIFLYFCEIRNMKKYLTLVDMAHVNVYKLEKIWLQSIGINLTNMTPVIGL